MSRHQPPGMSYGAWLGMAGMAIIGVAAAGIAIVAAFFAAFGGAGTFAVYAVFAGLTAVPAIVLWLKGNRYLRASAAGLAASLLSASVYVLLSPWATMGEGEVERAKAEAVASGNPAFYLGDEVDGYPLNDYYLGSDQANFFYGECRQDPNTADDPDPPACTWDVEVYTSGPMSPSVGTRSPGVSARNPWRESPLRICTTRCWDPTRSSCSRASPRSPSRSKPSPASASNSRLPARYVESETPDPPRRCPAPRPSSLSYVEENCAPIPER